MTSPHSPFPYLPTHTSKYVELHSFGLACKYLPVVWIELCESVSFTRDIFAPLSRPCLFPVSRNGTGRHLGRKLGQNFFLFTRACPERSRMGNDINFSKIIPRVQNLHTLPNYSAPTGRPCIIGGSSNPRALPWAKLYRPFRPPVDVHFPLPSCHPV